MRRTAGMGFRRIERVKGVHHTTLITRVRQVGERLPNAYAPDKIPEVGEFDELETFIGQENKIWIWTAVDILGCACPRLIHTFIQQRPHLLFCT